MEDIDKRPVIVAIAGPNGAGKSTFYEAYIQRAGLRFVNADVIARELNLDPYVAADVAGHIREQLVEREESFAFETVFSDPLGAKLEFLKRAVKRGYNVVFCFIGLDSASTSDERVAMRVSKGGHDVPLEKLKARYPRSLLNLVPAIRDLPIVKVFDNSDLADPFRPIAEYRNGELIKAGKTLPLWFQMRSRTKSSKS